MNLHTMIEICLKDDNMHIFVMINALICINNYVITCINSMLSAFKGRILSNLATIRDQSRLDWITIKSRKQGVHKELKILLKNCLIPSQLNQE